MTANQPAQDIEVNFRIGDDFRTVLSRVRQTVGKDASESVAVRAYGELLLDTVASGAYAPAKDIIKAFDAIGSRLEVLDQSHRDQVALAFIALAARSDLHRPSPNRDKLMSVIQESLKLMSRGIEPAISAARQVIDTELQSATSKISRSGEHTRLNHKYNEILGVVEGVRDTFSYGPISLNAKDAVTSILNHDEGWNDWLELVRGNFPPTLPTHLHEAFVGRVAAEVQNVVDQTPLKSDEIDVQQVGNRLFDIVTACKDFDLRFGVRQPRISNELDDAVSSMRQVEALGTARV